MSSEYGWTDEVIWELPLCRLRQITATVQQRRYFSAREENGRFSWLARSLATFIAGGYMVNKGEENTALVRAGQLSYDSVEAALLGVEPEEAVAGSARKHPIGLDGKAVDIDPNEAVARALARNGNGSFERFGRMTGQLEARGKMI